MDADWESDLAALLRDLLAVQDELLAFLTEKGRLLARVDAQQLAALAPREQQLCQQLQQCYQRRRALLDQASRQGMPAKSLRALTAVKSDRQLKTQVRQAATRSRLLQHHSLANWLLIQRTLLHLSQLLEIIGTGGRQSPTYGKERPSAASGALVDQAV